MLYKAGRKIEKVKAQARAKVEHPFRVIRRQFGYVKTRFRGIARLNCTGRMGQIFLLSKHGGREDVRAGRLRHLD